MVAEDTGSPTEEVAMAGVIDGKSNHEVKNRRQAKSPENHSLPPDLLKDYVPRVVVKFKHVDWEDSLHYNPDRYLPKSELDDLKVKFRGLAVEQLFTSLPPDRIHQLVTRAEERAEEMDATYRAPNFLTYFRVACPSGDPYELARALARKPRVEFAYVESPPTMPPAVTPNNNPLYQSTGFGQRYLQPAPVGIDAVYAWNAETTYGKKGGDGLGLEFVDMEQGWTLDHDDLPQGAGMITCDGNNKWLTGHGAAVLGIVRAVDNYTMCVGVTPNLANTRVVSEWRNVGDTAPNRVDAISVGINMLNPCPGAVLLLETQIETRGYNGQEYLYFKNLPVELEKAAFDMIKLGTQLNIVIVEAAGNGGFYRDPIFGYDLDLYPWGLYMVESISGQPALVTLNRADPCFTDSGAIMVAGAQVHFPKDCTDPQDPKCWENISWDPWSATNFGSRVDCFAWADGVVTIGGDGLDGPHDNTENFGGTSSASAIIAGAALAVQGLSQANRKGDLTNYRFSPTRLRDILSSCKRSNTADATTGNTLSAGSKYPSNPAAPLRFEWDYDRIGVMPNLRAIIQNENLLQSIFHAPVARRRPRRLSPGDPVKSRVVSDSRKKSVGLNSSKKARNPIQSQRRSSTKKGGTK